METDALKSAATPLDHAEAIVLLPFYATGVLDPSERRAVESHLQSCIACRRELTNERRTQRAFQQSEPIDAMINASYQRMTALLDLPAGPRQSAGEVKHVAPRPAHRAPWLAVAMAASVAAVVVGSLGLWTGTADAPAPYRTLAREEATAYRIVADAQVVFRHGVAPARAAATLHAEGLEVLSGPSAVEAYAVRRHPGNDRPLQQVLAAVAARPEVLQVYPSAVAGERR